MPADYETEKRNMLRHLEVHVLGNPTGRKALEKLYLDLRKVIKVPPVEVLLPQVVALGCRAADLNEKMEANPNDVTVGECKRLKFLTILTAGLEELLHLAVVAERM